MTVGRDDALPTDGEANVAELTWDTELEAGWKTTCSEASGVQINNLPVEVHIFLILIELTLSIASCSSHYSSSEKFLLCR
jgi:hypothetical protein